MNMLVRNYRAWGEVKRRDPRLFWLAWGGIFPLWVILCAVIGAHVARGQETSIKFCPPYCTGSTTSGTVKTPEWTNTQGFWGLTLAGSVAEISAAGDVTIDWPAAETMRAREYVGYDPTTVAVVRLMFAVRDSTWKPREPK